MTLDNTSAQPPCDPELTSKVRDAADAALKSMLDGNSGAGVAWHCLRDAEKALLDKTCGTSLTWSNAAEIQHRQVTMRKEIIEGLVRVGEVVVTAGETKIGKTWLSMRMAHAVSTGGQWLGQKVRHRGPVLYVNMELDRSTYEVRMKTICDDGGSYPSGMHFAHLRGTLTDVPKLLPELIRHAKATGAVMIILDALYNLLGDRDENSNGDMAALMAELTELATLTDCAVVVVHHFNKSAHKGDDGTSGAVKMSGAGSLHRSPEGTITITRVGDKLRKDLGKEDRLVLRVEATLRTFKDLKPFYVEKLLDTPVYLRLDIEPRLESKPRVEPKATLDQLVAWMGDKSLLPKEIKPGFSKHKDCGPRTVETLLRVGLAAGRFTKNHTTGTYSVNHK